MEKSDQAAATEGGLMEYVVSQCENMFSNDIIFIHMFGYYFQCSGSFHNCSFFLIILAPAPSMTDELPSDGVPTPDE